MKIRQGFVSNSSATSFCILGYMIRTYEEAEEILEKMKLSGINAIMACSQSGDTVVGVGNHDDEIDHYMDDYEDWQDYEADGPTKEEIESIEKFGKHNTVLDEEGKEIKISYYSETFFNG